MKFNESHFPYPTMFPLQVPFTTSTGINRLYLPTAASTSQSHPIDGTASGPSHVSLQHLEVPNSTSLASPSDNICPAV